MFIYLFILFYRGWLCVVTPLHEGGRTLPWVTEQHWSTCDIPLWRMAPRTCKQRNGHTPGNDVYPPPELLQGSQLSLGPVHTGLDKKFCMDKILHGSILRLHETGGTGRIFGRLSVQIWDLLFSGPKLALSAVQKFRRLVPPVQCKRKVEECTWCFCPCKNVPGPV